MLLEGDEAWIGAPRAAVGSLRSGYVERFERTSGSWQFIERIDCPAPRPGAMFGATIARDGTRVAVGAPRLLPLGGSDFGAVFVFVRSMGVWTLEDRVDPPVAGTRDFGHSIALDGDLLVVGDPEFGQSGTGTSAEPGAAFFFERTPTGYQHVSTFEGAPGSETAIGSAVATGRVGTTTVVAVGAEAASQFLGRVDVLVETQGVWTAAASALVPPSAAIGAAGLGASLDFSGERIVAGAPFLQIFGSGSNSGGAVVFEPEVSGQASSWRMTDVLVGLDGEPNALVGWSLEADDGRVALGAPQAVVGSDDIGRAVVLDPTASGSTTVCAGVPNVTGVPATLAFRGSTSVATNLAWFEAADLPTPSFCLGVYGQRGFPFPLGGGLLCIDTAPPGITRFTPPIAIDPAGGARLDIDFAGLPPATAIVGNSAWTFQCWYRDANPLGSNLSEAVEVRFCP